LLKKRGNTCHRYEPTFSLPKNAKFIPDNNINNNNNSHTLLPVEEFGGSFQKDRFDKREKMKDTFFVNLYLQQQQPQLIVRTKLRQNLRVVMRRKNELVIPMSVFWREGKSRYRVNSSVSIINYRSWNCPIEHRHKQLKRSRKRDSSLSKKKIESME
jgi:hypothetical protein